MPTASTVASMLVALAVIAVVVRWPRPRADHRILERRAHSLDALAIVVARSADTRHDDVERFTRRQAPANRTLADQADNAPVAGERSSDVERPDSDAITVLGPHVIRPAPDHPSHPHAARRARRRPHSRGTSASVPNQQPRSTSRPDRVIQLRADDVPPDEELRETIDELTSPHEGASVHFLSTGSPHPSSLAVHGTIGSTSRPPTTTAFATATATATATTTAALPPPPLQRARPGRVSRGGRSWPQVRARRGPVAAVVLTVIVGGLVFALGRPAPGPIGTAGSEPAAAQAQAPTPSTDTTVPEPLLPVATTGDAVTFDVPIPFSLDLAAAAATWVRVQATSGDVLYEGTLAPGDTTSVPVSGPVQVRVGNPGGLLATADGHLLDHPRPPGEPLTLTLGTR